MKPGSFDNLTVVFGRSAAIFRAMKRGHILKISAALCLAGFCLAARAELKENPYQVIVDRNPFSLRPPPPPPVATVVETNPPAPPPPDIKLTGITTLLGVPRAMFQVEDKQAKKATFPTIEIGETDSASGISVVSIDADAMKVRIRQGDAETTLDFKSHGVKPGSGIAASATPVPPPGLNLGAAVVPNPAAAAAAAAAQANNSRGAIVAGGSVTPQTAPVNYPNAAMTTAASGAVPARPMRTDNNYGIIGGGLGGNVYNPNAPSIPAPQPAMSREEAEARIELARQNLKAQQEAGQLRPGMPAPSILPPTSLGRALNQPPGGNVPPPGPR